MTVAPTDTVTLLDDALNGAGYANERVPRRRLARALAHYLASNGYTIERRLGVGQGQRGVVTNDG